MENKPGFLMSAEEIFDRNRENIAARDRFGIKEKNPPMRDMVLREVADLCGADQVALPTVMRERAIDGIPYVIEMEYMGPKGEKRFFLYSCGGRFEGTQNATPFERSETTIEEMWYYPNGQLFFAETVRTYKDNHFT